MPLQRLKDLLDRNGVHYESIVHLPAYTAQNIAALTHISGKEVAKTVIVKLEGSLAMAVLPASHRIDLRRLQAATGAGTVTVASEAEFKDAFPGCETGAMPPFGSLYGLPVLVDETVTHDREIVFNAGSHTELVRLAYADFARLEGPKVLKFSAGSSSAAA
ncbi:MAG TPA: YbaK/EbsC family protein [Terriglobales bacterium]|nr:YbaK/EbsC family protein [Terriglobales bacterium]